MPMKRFLYILLGLLLTVGHALADDANRLAAQIREGGHVVMIRHALAPGSGDPANFRLGDCSTQRNLDDQGRDQARRIGRWLREQGLASVGIYSSQWCRCLETARLLELGDVVELPALNSFFERPEDREPNLKALREFLTQLTADTQPIVMVTHYVTIAGITGVGVSSGEAVVLRLKGRGEFEVAGRLRFGN